MGMIVDDLQTLDGLVNQLKCAFQSGETMSELISELKDVFADDLKILVRKIIAHKPSFRAEANKQPKHQYAHKLHDQYYAVIAHSVLLTSDHTENLPTSVVICH